MATISSRLTNTGTLLINGTIDEFLGVPVIDSSVVLWADPAQTASYPGTGTTWYDLSSSQNTGTLTSAATFDTITGGGSFNFAGTNYSTLSANLVPSGSRSITIAFKPTDNVNRSGVISTRDGAGGWFVCINRNGQQLFTYSLNNVATNNDLSANVISQTNVWYIATITHDAVANIGNIYMNGTLVASATMGQILPVTTLNSYVGREINSGQNFPGWIGDVIVYNRALSATEVLKNHNALAPRYGLPSFANVTNSTRQTVNNIASSGFDEVTYNPALPVTAVKNLVQYSQQIGQPGTAWSSVNGTSTANAAVAPDGTVTATLFQGNAGNSVKYVGQGFSTLTAPTSYTGSIYLKAGTESNVVVRLDDNNASQSDIRFTANLVSGILSASQGGGANITAASGSITSVGNGWYRVAVTGTFLGNATQIQLNALLTYYGASTFTTNFYLWGAQVEFGNVLTMYQPIAAANTLLTTSTVRKIDTQGNYYIRGTYDEWTGAPVVDSSIQVWLDAGQSASYSGSGSTITDLSGKANNGTLTNSPGYDSPTGSLVFNGQGVTSGNTITFGSATGSTIGLYQSSFTVGAWVNTSIATYGNSAASLGGGVFSINGSAAAGGQYAIFYRWGQLWVDFYGGGQSTAIINTNTWYYVCHTYNYTTKNSVLYLNGVAVSTSTRTQDLISSVGSTGPIVGYYGLGGSYWNGKISAVHVHNRDLTADEVTQNFNALRRRYGI